MADLGDRHRQISGSVILTLTINKIEDRRSSISTLEFFAEPGFLRLDSEPEYY